MNKTVYHLNRATAFDILDTEIHGLAGWELVLLKQRW